MKLPSFLRTPRSILGLLLPILLFGLGWYFGLPPKMETSGETADASGEVWTCSMHPQIRQPNPGLCPICNMDLIPLQDDGGGGLREVAVSEDAAALLDLRISPVRRAAAEADIRLFGKLGYDERRISSVTARVGGRLDRLYVDFTGARVRKGDHLAEIYSPELFVAQKELISARKAFEKLDAGSSPAARDTRRRLLESARERLRLLQLGEAQIERIENQDEPRPTLQIGSPQDGVVVEKVVSEGSYVKTGDAILRVADLDSVWLMVEAYESDLPWIRYGQELEFTVDSIPGETFHGRVAFIDPELDPVRRVVSVRANVENPGQRLKPGLFAKVRLASRMTATGRVIDPQLAGKWISPMHPEIIKDGPGQCDICGMDLVPAESLGFIAEDHPEADPLLVPRSAVLQTGDRAVVYVRLPEKSSPVFEGREIVLGPAVGDEFVVLEGLAEGELVVSRGAFKLDSELQIKGKPSMMNPNAGLEERPAGEAPEELSGQWSPVLRALGRFETAVRAGNGTGMADHLKALRHAVEGVRTDNLQPDTLKLWDEFSNRLLVDLTLAERKLANEPATALGIVSRSIETAGRHLGLPFQPVEVPKADPSVVGSLRQAVDAYLPVAQALAGDDEAKAKAAANNFARTLEKLELPESEILRAAAGKLAAADGIKAVRAAFQPVSDLMIALARTHGIDQLGNLYVVHCPMAFGSAGADWLSSEPKVLNPYFGDAMLTCGSVTDTLSVADQAAKPGTESTDD